MNAGKNTVQAMRNIKGKFNSLVWEYKNILQLTEAVKESFLLLSQKR